MKPAPSTSPETIESRFARDVLAFAEEIRAYVRARVYDPHDAEDLIQEILLKLFRSRTALRDPRRLRAWAFRTTRTTIADHFRRQRPFEMLPATLAADPAPAFPDEAARRMHRSVRQFIHTLPEKYRRPLERAVFDGATVRAIAAELALSETAVKSRLARARAMLRQRLLACCHFEFDAYGKILDLRPHGPCACHNPRTDPPPAAGAPPLACRLRPAHPDDHPAIIHLLHSVQLPTEDLEKQSAPKFIVLAPTDNNRAILGCAAVEPHGRDGLLRSVAVHPDHRGRGLGRQLVVAAEQLASDLGIDRLYLLTDDAASWFARLGYRRIERKHAPASITGTAQFATLCPDSATLMTRRLQERQPSSASAT